MEDNPSRKRQFLEDDDSSKQPMKKRVRFPKGKKVKPGEELLDKGKAVEDSSTDLNDARLAAKKRANRRNQITYELCSEESKDVLTDVSAAEVTYEDDERFFDDGIQIEPFNLDKEREEGYFDAEGNFVEYVDDKNEIKDAWLDSLEADPRHAGKGTAMTKDKDIEDNDGDGDDVHELSSEDIGLIKRRIANVLEPGETVIQALKRLKGTSGNKKEKMLPETKRIFDQLTEDAMKLMEENGEYNVYHEKQEIFEREAEGFERLARARAKGISASASLGDSDLKENNDMFADATDPGTTSSLPNVGAAEMSSTDADSFDMFADDDDKASAKPSSDGMNSVTAPNSNAMNQTASYTPNLAFESAPNSNAMNQTASYTPNLAFESGSLQYDYVYDEASGYYYSSSLGYYYDPSTGLYCSAASGQWYSFNEEMGTYEEVQEVASSAS